KKLGRATSNAFAILFALAAVIATGATYLSITENTPNEAGQPGLLWLLIANFIIIVGLGLVMGTRVLRLLKENRETDGGARLRLRIIFLFSLAAAVPTVIVAGFLAVGINRTVDSWFSEPVTRIVDQGTAAARAAIDDLGDEARKEVTAIIDDFGRPPNATVCQASLEALKSCMVTRSQIGGLFRRVEAYNSQGQVLFDDLVADGAAPALHPPPEYFAQLRAGQPLWGKENLNGAVRILFKPPGFDDVYIWVARTIPPKVLERLTQADQSNIEFQTARARRERLSLVLMLSYIEAALLMLLGTAWLGMTAAERIALPIGALAGAARAVRDGDLSVRMLKPGVRDEIADLADAFNEMTDRLSRQTQALDRGRIDAETRSHFIEAVLAGVEAGVIRVDGNLKVTIANASAQTLLEFIQRPGESTDLGEIAPEFVSATRRSLETQSAVEAVSKRETEGGTMHFQVRVAPEEDMAREDGAGAVITFHDTTRLVQGQRQAAWRDVARRIAHEIRNPLTPIQLSAERLKRKFSSQITSDRETFDRCTETITRQVADLGRMVEEFSGFARMPKPTFGDFNLADVVQSVAFAQRMATPNITVSVTTPSPVHMNGDERLLAQALTNIVKNAAEAVERQVEAGEIDAGSVTIDVTPEDEEVQVTVRDNGPGFPVQDRDRVLEPYVTTRKSGVGLGLAIVSRIVEDHGGRIWLGDNEHSTTGARVDIRMPVEPKLSEDLVAYAGEGAA
ncbi:MAG TPA: ATP-binding protein, partial [Hyphomonadaceae bacterium]|nr:ATP-binding protein [Hyphomonadaceae bacterium]